MAKRTFRKYPSNYVKAYSDLSNNPSMYVDVPQPTPQIELTDEEVKVLLSYCIDAWISNKSIDGVIRHAIFNCSPDMDWQSVYREILRQFPEFRSPKGQETILTYVGRNH